MKTTSSVKNASITVVTAAAALIAGCASTTNDSAVGEGRKQLLLLPQQQVLQSAQAYYAQELDTASRKGVLLRSGREYERLRTILNRIVPATAALRPEAVDWKWELALIDEPETVNAHVLAGGKVTFYTGIIVKTRASDDELAAVMGHEIAHALREHGREKMSQQAVFDIVRDVGLSLAGADAATRKLAQMGQSIALDLPFSRAMESEADTLGLELAARAGYNPRGAVTLWEKMSALGSSGGPAFMSTHPASQDRRNALEALLPTVVPLYEHALRSPLPASQAVPAALPVPAAKSRPAGKSYDELLTLIGKEKRLSKLVGTLVRVDLRRGGDAGWTGFVVRPNDLLFFSCPTAARFDGGSVTAKIKSIRSNDIGVFVSLDQCGVATAGN